jgi:hypothetical protein
MIASLLPLRNGYCASVVIDETADPVEVRAVLSVPAGRLVALDEPTGRYNARRVVDDEAAHELAAQVVPLWQAHGVQRVLVVRPEKSWKNTEHGSEASQRVADVIAMSCPEGIELRALKAWNKGGWTLEEVAALPSWPAWATYRVARMAGALALFAARGEARKVRDSKILAQAHGIDDGMAGQGANAAAGVPPSPPQDKRPRLGALGSTAPVAPAPREPKPVEPGARIAGFDPGSAYAGLAIAEVGPLPLRAIYADTLSVGERVRLAEPKVVVRADGSSKVTMFRHSVTTEHVDALARTVVARLLEHNVTHLVIEHVDAVFLSAERASAHMSQATAIARASWIDGAVGEAARAAGVEVVRVSASAWRGVVLGRSKAGFQGDERVRAAIDLGFTGWPIDADEHARDAAGLCLWLLRPKEKKAQKAARRPLEVQAPEPKRKPARTLAREAREAAGCHCTRRHRYECPLYVPMTYKPRATMPDGLPVAEGVSPPSEDAGGRL